jgi:hypothetical protein
MGACAREFEAHTILQIQCDAHVADGVMHASLWLCPVVALTLGKLWLTQALCLWACMWTGPAHPWCLCWG